MSTLFVSILTTIYLGLLFVVAWRADARTGPYERRRPAIYALSLGIYCTSWTYFGAVGTAARSGWEYLPIYLGPSLAIVVGFPLWRRILTAAKRERVGSIADFLVARYALSRGLGALVTLVLLVSALPYIALQLHALSEVMTRLAGAPAGSPRSGLAVCLIAAALALFAILFGARRADMTEHNRGLVQAIAAESAVKLVGICAAAGLAVSLLISRDVTGADITALARGLTRPPDPTRFAVLTLLAAAAILCLPRQFHMSFVEAQDHRDIDTARIVLPLYLLVFSLAALPVAAAGTALLSPALSPDFFVVDLSLAFAPRLVGALVLLGGISAATAMVIVECVALSAMISNHLVLPLARKWLTESRSADAAGVIVLIRRTAIVAILALATLYFFASSATYELASAGLVAFAGAAQLAPALIGAVTWRRAGALGAILGVSAGFVVWLYTLLIPQLSTLAPMLADLPQIKLGSDPLVSGAVLSLAVNVAAFVLGSLASSPRDKAQMQAAAFTRAEPAPRRLGRTAGELKALVAKFLGDEAAQRAFAAFEIEADRKIRPGDPVDRALARGAELMLAGALGASSARSVLARTLSDNPRHAVQVARLLDEAAQAVQFNRELLQATLDNLTEGVSVVDADLRLVAWNAAYLQLFELPPELVHVGRPIADIYRYNAAGELAGPELEALVERRLASLRKRQRHVYERVWRNDRVLRASGAPMPGGGYVTSYTDVTDLRRTADALQAANERLEERVAMRTEELAQAKAQAEAATESKTHFLAAASHDLLQPLHAARLFLGALADTEDTDAAQRRELATSADRAITAANGMLRALLNLSRLEAGGVTPQVATVDVGLLLTDLAREHAATAAVRGLELKVAASTLAVFSDHDLLRSMMQNLVANALRYTSHGKVLVGARRCGPRVRLEVHDTGRGIPEAARRRIFQPFERLDDLGDGEGAGLGLAIVERTAQLLGHAVGVRSTPGKGSTFWIEAPRANAPAKSQRQPRSAPPPGDLAGLRVLCVDNEPEILSALAALLRNWKVEPVLAGSAAEALAQGGAFDASLVDQQLTDGDGLSLIQALGSRAGRCALITASTSEEVAAEAKAQGVPMLRKPVKPAGVRAFLAGARRAAID